MNSWGKAKMFLLGVLCTLCMMVMLAATSGGSVGMYQIACTADSAYVVNTRTGEVRSLGDTQPGYKYIWEQGYRSIKQHKD
jgi:hypothetical protein